ncbi:MAG TPA: DEAD/DEAH box helicase [Acidimicrobiales bacterium]|nr:DEAD/DEAH box helicase [Acidimicrobiales bacterium]
MSTSGPRQEFLAGLGFTPDPFQVRAMDALDDGRSVLVAAPTGSGKTVVAEYAVAKALAEGGKAFYTSPLKALSNQKYSDLAARHGAGRVGLLTGDNAINGEAPVVVMTTEVLRNMIYAGAHALGGLRYVILDEVHYLQDPYRGAVWEEVIIHLDPAVKLVCLSATVSNAEDFASWIETVRGATAAVIEERRPVELRNLYLVGDRGSDALHLMPTFVDGRPNPEAAALDSRAARPVPGRRRGRLYTPRRTEVIDALAEADILPAIYFIFSRAACDDAVRQCLSEGIRLTSADERRQIRALAEAKVELLSDEDLRVLDYPGWLAGLEAGLASHHAGLVPPFKEAVEACFTQALVKVVFATETLALGINMPARSVVIEKLSKFTGERHEFLTPGEYTQLTGRAGRRGIDDLGHAVVLWSPFVPFEQVAGLASNRAHALTSSFRPTYNMAANLVRRCRPDHARHLLNLSFAQYRADAEVVRLEAQLDRTKARLEEARLAAACDLGSVEEYRRLIGPARGRSRAGVGERGNGEGGGSSRDEIRSALERVRPGDVLLVPGVSSGGRLAVISTARRRGGEVKLTGVNSDTRRIVLTSRDLSAPLRAVARVGLPTPYDPTSNRFVREVAASLRHLNLPDAPPAPGHRSRRRSRDDADLGPPAGAGHPVARCPDRAGHVRAAERADRLALEAERLERRIRGRTESLARQFDRVLRILEEWGYVDGWALTAAGERLARIYHECDLLVAECLAEEIFSELDPPGLAALASLFTFESRGPTAYHGGYPSRFLRDRCERVEALARELNRAEEEAGLPTTRNPDSGFVALAHAWAAGRPLHQVLADEAISGGDFVRNIKQLIDLVRQLAVVAPDPATRRTAEEAADALFRGVVAASSVVDQRASAS